MLIKLSDVKARYGMNIKGIIHVGAHVGQEFEMYMNCLVKNVAFFEPCTPAYEKLQQRFVIDRAALGFPQVDVQLFKIALGAYQGEGLMYVETANEGQSNSLLEPAEHLKTYPTIEFTDKELVQVMPLDRMDLDMSKYNMLNMDVQGGELEVLKGAKAILPYIDYVYTEVNTAELYKGAARLEQIDEFLSDFERKEIEMTDAGWGDALYIRKKTALPDQPVKEPAHSTTLSATEAISVTESTYLNGMVVQDENSIYFGSGVTVTLDRTRYLMLAGQMSKQLAASIQAHHKADEAFWENARRMRDLIIKLRSVFYNDYEDVMIRKSFSEIDPGVLDELLEDASELLDFETRSA